MSKIYHHVLIKLDDAVLERLADKLSDWLESQTTKVSLDPFEPGERCASVKNGLQCIRDASHNTCNPDIENFHVNSNSPVGGTWLDSEADDIGKERCPSHMQDAYCERVVGHSGDHIGKREPIVARWDDDEPSHDYTGMGPAPKGETGSPTSTGIVLICPSTIKGVGGAPIGCKHLMGHEGHHHSITGRTWGRERPTFPCCSELLPEDTTLYETISKDHHEKIEGARCSAELNHLKCSHIEGHEEDFHHHEPSGLMWETDEHRNNIPLALPNNVRDSNLCAATNSRFFGPHEPKTTFCSMGESGHGGRHWNSHVVTDARGWVNPVEGGSE